MAMNSVSKVPPGGWKNTHTAGFISSLHSHTHEFTHTVRSRNVKRERQQELRLLLRRPPPPPPPTPRVRPQIMSGQFIKHSWNCRRHPSWPRQPFMRWPMSNGPAASPHPLHLQQLLLLLLLLDRHPLPRRPLRLWRLPTPRRLWQDIG